MKKFAFLIIIIAAGAAFCFLQSSNIAPKIDEVRKKTQDDVVVVEFEDQAAKKVKGAVTPSSKQEKVDSSDNSAGDEKEGLVVKTDEELERRLEEKEEEFDRIEEKWLNDVKDLFLNELQLTQNQYRDYLNMREGLFSDKIDAFEDMHDQLEKKHGEDYSYNPTEEEMAFDREIQKKYDDLLLKKIGKESFIKYLELRDRTNEEILENTAQDDAALIMEF